METEGAQAPAPGEMIELGWLLVTDVSGSQRRALDAAREQVRKRLEADFPGFAWRTPLVEHAGAAPGILDEPVARLVEGAQARDSRAWDFALVVTANDLRSHYKSYAFAVPSQALAVAVLSLARLAPTDPADPVATGRASVGATADDVDAQARRIAALALHLLGDLTGLWHRDAPDAVMHGPSSVEDLDRPRVFSADEAAQLSRALAEVADLRLEETPDHAQRAAPLFYLRACWERHGEIRSAVLQARPWELPLRLTRLTTAALSALFLLLVTAEVWDLGTSQSGPFVATLSLLTLTGTTAFVLARQRLILRRPRRGPTEQTVVTNVSAALVVALGFATTYALLFVITVAAGAALFGPELVARWAPAVEARQGWPRDLAVLAGLVSSLGLLIGSLGASFEGNQYFQHVIYADEET